jgi:hypothetical protein
MWACNLFQGSGRGSLWPAVHKMTFISCVRVARLFFTPTVSHFFLTGSDYYYYHYYYYYWSRISKGAGPLRSILFDVAHASGLSLFITQSAKMVQESQPCETIFVHACHVSHNTIEGWNQVNVGTSKSAHNRFWEDDYLPFSQPVDLPVQPKAIYDELTLLISGQYETLQRALCTVATADTNRTVHRRLFVSR